MFWSVSRRFSISSQQLSFKSFNVERLFNWFASGLKLRTKGIFKDSSILCFWNSPSGRTIITELKNVRSESEVRFITELINVALLISMYKRASEGIIGNSIIFGHDVIYKLVSGGIIGNSTNFGQYEMDNLLRWEKLSFIYFSPFLQIINTK